MPDSVAAEQRRLSYATRAVRSAFTDNALAKWIASRLRSSAGTSDAALLDNGTIHGKKVDTSE